MKRFIFIIMLLASISPATGLICRTGNIVVNGTGGGNFSGSWNDLTDVPVGFADDTDDTGSFTNGTAIQVNNIESDDWTDISINTGQISNLTHTTDTTIANCSGAGSCSNIAYLNTLNNGNINFTGNITMSHWYGTGGTIPLGLEEASDDLIMHAHVGGTNYFGIETDGAFFQLYANPGVANNYLLASFAEVQGADTYINIYEGGTGHNRFWDSGSLRIGGGKSHLCSNLTTDVDCDTPSTGADLVVEDDIWSGGKIYATDWTDITIHTGQITNLTHGAADGYNTTTELDRDYLRIENLNGSSTEHNKINVTGNCLQIGSNYMSTNNSGALIISSTPC